MEQKESRRSQMTKKLLQTALVELMQEKPFKQINIKELCERADLNRTTFYLHYTDQQSVLDDIMQEIERRTDDYMENVSPSAKTVDYIEAFLIYIQKNALLFRTLLCNEDAESFRMEFIQHTLDKVRGNLPHYGNSLQEKYILTFLMQGSVHILIEWINSDFDITSRQAAGLIFSLCDSVRPAFEKEG